MLIAFQILRFQCWRVEVLRKGSDYDFIFRGEFRRGEQGARTPPLIFPRKKLRTSKKIQKHNVSKISQIETRLKEITRLMTIAETKKTNSAFQFFHKHYWNGGSGKLIAAVQASNLRRSELWQSIATLCALRKNNSSGMKAASEECF